MSTSKPITIVSAIRDARDGAASPRGKVDRQPLRHLQGIADVPQVEDLAPDNPAFKRALRAAAAEAVAQAMATKPAKR